MNFPSANWFNDNTIFIFVLRDFYKLQIRIGNLSGGVFSSFPYHFIEIRRAAENGGFNLGKESE